MEPKDEVQERRRHPRFPLACELRGHELGLLQAPKVNRVIQATVENISSGGLCMVTSRQIKKLRPVRCELMLSSVPVPIPVVMQVRWTRKIPEGRGYKIGLEFLL